MQGQTQGELNQQGIEQAQQVAQRLAKEPIDAVVASDLHRAIRQQRLLLHLMGYLSRQHPCCVNATGVDLQDAIFLN